MPGDQALRILRLSYDDVKGNLGPRISASFLKEKRKKRVATTKERKSGKTGDFIPPQRPAASTSKGKGPASHQSDDELEASEPNLRDWPVSKPSGKRALEMPKQRGSSFSSKRKRVVSSEEEDNGEDISVDTANDLADFIDDEGVDISQRSHDEMEVPDTDEDESGTWSFSFGVDAAGKRSAAAPSSRNPRKRPKITNGGVEIIELSD